jgi:hypothetical protein
MGSVLYETIRYPLRHNPPTPVPAFRAEIKQPIGLGDHIQTV